MKTHYLLPNCFKKIGWILLLPFMGLSIYCLDMPLLEPLRVTTFALVEDGDWFQVTQNGILDEIGVIGLTLSLMFIVFSREREEDEYIAKIRSESMIWALLVNYSLMIIGTVIVYGIEYFYFMAFGMFSVLILYCMKFNYAIYKFNKSASDEE